MCGKQIAVFCTVGFKLHFNQESKESQL